MKMTKMMKLIKIIISIRINNPVINSVKCRIQKEQLRTIKVNLCQKVYSSGKRDGLRMTVDVIGSMRNINRIWHRIRKKFSKVRNCHWAGSTIWITEFTMTSIVLSASSWSKWRKGLSRVMSILSTILKTIWPYKGASTPPTKLAMLVFDPWNRYLIEVVTISFTILTTMPTKMH